MDRMLARVAPLQCKVCRTPLGPDCAPRGCEKRSQKTRERDQVRRTVLEETG